MQSAKNFAKNFADKAAGAAKNMGNGQGMPEGGGVPPGVGSLIVRLGSLGALAYGAYKSVVIVGPGHQGVVYNRFGMSGGGLSPTTILGEGINFVIPWFQRPYIYNIRFRSQVVNTSSGSKDLQIVQISLRVLFRPDPSKLNTVYSQLGKDYDSRVLPSIVNEITKAVVAKYNASELMIKRDEVSAMVKSLLQSRAKDFNIIIDEVAINHIAFTKDYAAAVEAKQVAQQEAERARYVVEKALQEKKATVIKAEGEAKSAQLIGDAIRENPAFVQLRKIEATRDIAKAVVSGNNKVYVNSDTLLINDLGTQYVPKKKAGWW